MIHCQFPFQKCILGILFLHLGQYKIMQIWAMQTRGLSNSQANHWNLKSNTQITNLAVLELQKPRTERPRCKIQRTPPM